MGPAYMAWGVKLALAGAWLAAACMVMVPASAAEPPSTPAEFYVSSSQVGGIPSEDVNGCGTTVLLPCRTLGFAWEQYVAEDTIATFFLRSGSYEVPFQPNSTAVSLIAYDTFFTLACPGVDEGGSGRVATVGPGRRLHISGARVSGCGVATANNRVNYGGAFLVTEGGTLTIAQSEVAACTADRYACVHRSVPSIVRLA